MSKLYVAGIVKESVVDGPGLRYVIFTQGCPHRCVGCHNPHTHDFNSGYELSIDELLDSIIAMKLICGITFSGGEPFVQADSCAKLAKLVKHDRKEFNIVSYSGYYYSDLLVMAKKDVGINDFLQTIDILIDGPYDETQRRFDLPFRGSGNQNIIDLAALRRT